MSKISAVTGLPEAPEGLYWKITSPSNHYRSDGVLWVCLCSDYVVEVVEEYTELVDEPIPLTWRNCLVWWWGSKTQAVEHPKKWLKPEEKTKTHASAGLRESKSVPKGFSDTEYTQLEAEGWRFSKAQSDFSDEYLLVRDLDLTAENIRKVALSVLNTYNVEQEKKLREKALKARRDELIGNYPPKKIED